MLVLGFGNSAMDIAGRDLARRRTMTFLAVRRGVHVIPKYISGKPIDELRTPITRRLPLLVQRSF